MLRSLASARLFALACFLLLLTACGGGGGPTDPSGQQLVGTLGIDIRPLAGQQNSAIVPITLEIPRTGATTSIPVHLRIGYRITHNPNDPLRLLTAAPGSLDLNNRNTIIDIPANGLAVTFLWDALADLGPDWDPSVELTLRAGILAANANDPRQATCDVEPIITVSFGNSAQCVSDIPTIVTTNADLATVGQPYSFFIQTAGGEPPLTFQVIDQDTNNPDLNNEIGFGLFLNGQTGEITGTPTPLAPATINFVVRLTDSCGAVVATSERAGAQSAPNGRFDQGLITLPVQGGITPSCADAPVITTTALPNGQTDQPYSFQLEATGGEGTLSWSANGLDPQQLAVDVNGLITGTPTVPGTYTVTVTVADSCATVQTATSDLTLTIDCSDSGPTFQSPSALPDAFLGSVYDHTFVVDTPNGPGNVVIEAGSLPTGITMTPVLDAPNRQMRVSLRGTPSLASEVGQDFIVTLRATDGCPAGALSASSGFTIHLNAASTCTEAAPQLGTPGGGTALPGGTVGAPYSATLTVTGGTPPVGAITIFSGAPAGLTMQADGRTLAGTPTTAGSFNIVFDVADGCPSGARTDRETFTLDITAACDPLSVTTTSLPNGSNGTAYNSSVQAAGGFGSPSWSLTAASGPLPTGITLRANGLISGVPNTAPGVYPIEVQATDQCPSGAQTATKPLSITITDVGCPAVVLDTTAIPDPRFATPYDAQLQAGGGQPPLLFAITNGRLPVGLTMDNTGHITGTATDVADINQNLTFEVTVTDTCSPVPGTDVGQFTVTVRAEPCDPIGITNTSFPNPILNQSYNATLLGTGAAPFTWSLSAGALPTGMTVDPTGTIVGRPNDSDQVGDVFNFTLEIEDSCVPTTQTTTKDFSFTLEDSTSCAAIDILTTSVPDPFFNVAYNQTLTGTGEGALSWAVASGSLPSGITLSPAGVLSGTPTNPADAGQTFNFDVQLTDSCAPIAQTDLQSFSITVRSCTAIGITTETIDDPALNVPFSFQLEGAGQGTLSWSLVKSILPTGLTLDSAGLISGTATDAGQVGQVFNLTVQLMDSCPSGVQVDSANFSITVVGCSPLSIDNTGFANPVLGQGYSATLLASGDGPFTWSLEGGTLPAGMSVNPTGTLEGTPTNGAEVGTDFTFLLGVDDSCSLGSQHASAQFTFTLVAPVTCDTLDILTTSLPNPDWQTPYSQTLSVVGEAPFIWSLRAGSTLPTGLSFSNGTLSGTPTTASEIGSQFTFTVDVSDSCTLGSQSDSQVYTVTLTGPICTPLGILNTSFPDAINGQDYNVSLLAAGVAPFTWSLDGGSLPDGISVDPSGFLTGNPDEIPGDFNFTLRVTDSCVLGAQTATKSFTLTVNDAPQCTFLDILTEDIPDAVWNTPYSETLSVAGEAPYTWEFDSETGLPEGMDFADGTLSGTPTNPGDIGKTFDLFVTVTDSCADGPQVDSVDYTFLVNGPTCRQIDILNTSFSDPSFGAAYDATLLGAGEPPFLWSLQPGSTLPSGMALDPAGRIFGTPDDSDEIGQVFNFTIHLADSCVFGSHTADRGFSFTLQPQDCDPLDITTTSLPDATNGLPYSFQLQAGGGQPPLTWNEIGGLPSGLSVTTDGFITGNPDDEAGGYSVTVQVVDACTPPQTAQRTFNLNLTDLNCPDVSISTDFLPDAVFGEDYDVQLDVTGGSAPFTWELFDSPALPT
ncbi:MAG: Ig domain-containing protein, partial [bacterium]